MVGAHSCGACFSPRCLTQTKLHSNSSGKLCHEDTDHAGAVRVLGLSPNGRFLLSGGDDKVARVRDTATWATTHVL